ncbi:hypothetical protein SLEP1_g49162 [Rubroshorea leprosula]|uniref:Uncharacterized protein n=1 Tax=Rubroshorea leprosula TaxID=152421 RepID=A0AAV5LYZ5_9ROSI|nr:hypothetical protein SLEP1_g49162 [Rubroshorea leprosula]
MRISGHFSEIVAGSSPNCSSVVLGKFWFLIVLSV